MEHGLPYGGPPLTPRQVRNSVENDRNAARCIMINEFFQCVGIASALLISWFQYQWDGPTKVYCGITALQFAVAFLISAVSHVRWRHITLRKLCLYSLLAVCRMIVFIILGGTVLSWWYSIGFIPLCLLPTTCFAARIQRNIGQDNTSRNNSHTARSGVFERRDSDDDDEEDSRFRRNLVFISSAPLPRLLDPSDLLFPALPKYEDVMKQCPPPPVLSETGGEPSSGSPISHPVLPPYKE